MAAAQDTTVHIYFYVLEIYQFQLEFFLISLFHLNPVCFHCDRICLLSAHLDPASAVSEIHLLLSDDICLFSSTENT